MFHWKGDCNEWHNLACEPQMPIPFGILFALGAAVALAGRRAFLLAWITLMLLPAILAWEGGPHALRAIGPIPPVFLLTAVGADAAYPRLVSRSSTPTARRCRP